MQIREQKIRIHKVNTQIHIYKIPLVLTLRNAGTGQ